MKQIKKFVKDSINELKRVEWPSRKETIRLTSYVVGLSFGVGLFVMLFDYIFKELLTLIITK